MFRTRITLHFANELYASDSSPFLDDHGGVHREDCHACDGPCDTGRRELAEVMEQLLDKGGSLTLKTREAVLALWQACYYNEDKWQEWFASGDMSAGAFVKVARRFMREIEDQHPDVIEDYRKLVASWGAA